MMLKDTEGNRETMIPHRALYSRTDNYDNSRNCLFRWVIFLVLSSPYKAFADTLVFYYLLFSIHRTRMLPACCQRNKYHLMTYPPYAYFASFPLGNQPHQTQDIKKCKNMSKTSSFQTKKE